MAQKENSPFRNKYNPEPASIPTTGVLLTNVGIIISQRLSGRAHDLLSYIMLILTDEEMIVIDRDKYMELQRISSKATVSKSIRELTDAGFICQARGRGSYWTNPYYFQAI